MRSWRALILLATIALLMPRPGLSESRLALVIGNSAYTRIGALRNPVNDARAMDQALRSLGFEVIRLENASKAKIEGGLRQLSQRLNADAVSLVYYAGHGVQLEGRNYLIPVDTRIETAAAVQIDAVNVDEVLAQIGRAGGRMNIVILDACRNNPFVPETSDTSGRRVSTNDPRFRGISGGLASINAPAGILIAYATAPGRFAADGAGANGLYTAELIRAMTSPGASIETVFKQTRVAVMQKSGGTQTPWESSSLTGEFSFRPTINLPTVAAPTIAPSQDEKANGKCFVFDNRQFCE